MTWLVLILLSAILLAAWILMLRRDVMHEPNTQVFSWSYLVFVALLPVVSWLSGVPLEHQVFFENWIFFVIFAAALSISLFATTLAMKSLPLSVVGPLRNLSPLFVAILGLLLLGEKISLINTLGLLIVVLGVAMLDIDIRHPKNLREFKNHVKNPGSFLLVLAAISISFTPITARVILEKTNSFTLLFYVAVLLSVIFWTAHIISTRSFPWEGLRFREVLWILLTGVTILFADILYFLALAIPGALVAVIFGVRRLSNLFVTIFGGAMLHENNVGYKTVVSAIMVFGTILLVL